MKLLTFTNLYPNAVHPNLGVFVENRLRHLLEDPSLESRVVAPVPWFPFTSPVFGRYGAFASVPREGERFGISVQYPRYPVIPKIGMNLAPWLMYLAMRPVVRSILESGYDFDLIDAHFFYPDGVAAARLGKEFGRPVVITARGSDINYYPRHAVPKREIIWAAEQAAGLIAVSQALKDRMVELGVNPEKIRVLRNGVDLEMFRPTDQTPSPRTARGDCPVILSVGGLVPIKGHDLIIRALAMLPKGTLKIAGEGPLRAHLERLAAEVGVADRVDFLGAVPHRELAAVYCAADLMVLASEREGWPNVLLEAMACGTPVVGSAVGGVPEVIADPAAGSLFHDRTPEAIANAIRKLLADPPRRSDTRAYAEKFGWQPTSDGQRGLFQEILDRTDKAHREQGDSKVSNHTCGFVG